jgi:hypothetical protein
MAKISDNYAFAGNLVTLWIEDMGELMLPYASQMLI